MPLHYSILYPVTLPERLKNWRYISERLLFPFGLPLKKLYSVQRFHHNSVDKYGQYQRKAESSFGIYLLLKLIIPDTPNSWLRSFTQLSVLFVKEHECNERGGWWTFGNHTEPYWAIEDLYCRSLQSCRSYWTCLQTPSTQRWELYTHQHSIINIVIV